MPKGGVRRGISRAISQIVAIVNGDFAEWIAGQAFLLNACDTVDVQFSAGKVARVQDSSLGKYFEGAAVRGLSEGGKGD
jgi:hypothetical protein